MDTEEKTNINNYILSLNEKEKQGLEIAESHLGSSFDIKKSYGYKQWLADQKNKES